MLEQKFLDRFDIERRIQSRLYCFGSGASDDDGGTFSVTAGQDNIDRSNPAEMRAREQELQDQIISRTMPNVKVGSDEARDIFAGMISNPSDGLAAGIAEVQKAERAAAERQAANIRSGGGTNLPEAFTSAAAYQDLTDRTQRPMPTMGVGDFKVPNIVGSALTAIGNANMSNVKSKIDAGGTPIFNNGQIVGVTSPGLFGGTVYSGRPEFDPFSSSAQADNDDVVPPVTNPLTGRSQCPDGYVFDEDLQACRLGNKQGSQAKDATVGVSSLPAGDMFFRRTSLDNAPANLPEGFDFDAANRQFTQGFAIRPSFFQRPPDLTGFTLL